MLWCKTAFLLLGTLKFAIFGDKNIVFDDYFYQKEKGFLFVNNSV